MAGITDSLPPSGMKLFKLLLRLMAEKHTGEVVLLFDVGNLRNVAITQRYSVDKIPEG